MSLLTIGAFIILFAVGVAVIPAWIYLAGTPIGNNLLGKGMFALGQLGNGGTLIRYDGGGTVELLPFDADAARVYDADAGGWVEIDGEITSYRFGWGDVAIDADAEQSAPESVLVSPDNAVADGGEIDALLLDERRAGTRMFSDVDPSQPAIHYPRYLKQQGRQGNKLISRAKENALEEFGGGSQTGELMLMLLVLGGFISMFGITFAMLLVM